MARRDHREMQSQVADRVEKKLEQLPWVDKIETYSKPSFASISLTFRDSTPPREVPMLFLELRKKMVDVRPDLPDGVVGPLVNDTFGDVDSVLYTVTGDGASYAQLKDVAEAFRKRLQRVPDVTKVDLYGDQPERVFVEFSHAKLATLGAPLQSLFDSIAKQNALVPAGEFQTDAQRMPVRVTGAQQAADAVAETPVFAGGQTFRLATSRMSITATRTRRRFSSALRASPLLKSASSCRRAAISWRSARRSTRRSPSSRRNFRAA